MPKVILGFNKWILLQLGDKTTSRVRAAPAGVKKNQHRPAFFDGGEGASPTVLTQISGRKEILITHAHIPEKNAVWEGGDIVPNNSAQRTTSVYREEIRKKEANGTFSSFLPPQCGPFWSGSRLLMINPAAHGKIGTFTMEGVVLASEYHRATCLSFPCSPARSPWEPVAAVHGQIKQEKKPAT